METTKELKNWKKKYYNIYMVKYKKKYRGGSGMLKLSPSDIQFTPGGLSPSPNTLADPTRFPDNHAKLAGRGCAGDLNNVDAAAGQYKPYLKGGGGGVCLSSSPLVSDVTGPRAGYASIQRCQPNVAVNAMSLGAGGVSQVGSLATLRKWSGTGGRKTHRRRRRHGKSRRKRLGESRRKRRSKHKTLYKRSKLRRRKGAKRTRKRRRSHRGGSGQPYSNEPLSFGYGLGAPFNGKNQVLADVSALATPPPQHVYNHCKKNNFASK